MRVTVAPNCQEKRVCQLYTCQNMTQLTSFIYASLYGQQHKDCLQEPQVLCGRFIGPLERWCVIEYYYDDLYGTILFGRMFVNASFEGFSVGLRLPQNYAFWKCFLIRTIHSTEYTELTCWTKETYVWKSQRRCIFCDPQFGKAFYCHKINQHKKARKYIFALSGLKNQCNYWYNENTKSMNNIPSDTLKVDRTVFFLYIFSITIKSTIVAPKFV